jgi:ribosomal protein L37E
MVLPNGSTQWLYLMLGRFACRVGIHRYTVVDKHNDGNFHTRCIRCGDVVLVVEKMRFVCEKHGEITSYTAIPSSGEQRKYCARCVKAAVQRLKPVRMVDD